MLYLIQPRTTVSSLILQYRMMEKFLPREGRTTQTMVRVRFLLARYNKDGSPDNTFGIGGTATTYGSIMLGGGYAHSLAIQEDGKIIIGGAGFFLQR